MLDYIIQMCGYMFRQIIWTSSGHSKKQKNSKSQFRTLFKGQIDFSVLLVQNVCPQNLRN
jgi:hypothetical protein